MNVCDIFPQKYISLISSLSKQRSEDFVHTHTHTIRERLEEARGPRKLDNAAQSFVKAGNFPRHFQPITEHIMTTT